MKRVRRKKSRVREMTPGCGIMFTSNETAMGVSEVKDAGYDKLLASRVEGQVFSHRVEGVMNRLQVYQLALRDDDVDRDACITESVLRARECGNIVPFDKKRGPKKSRSGYATTKDKLKDDNNSDDDNYKAMDDADLESKAPHRTAWDLMWDNGGPIVWAPDYREQYDLKDA